MIYLIVAFLFIYLFSRALNNRERGRFIQTKQQRQLLQLFESLIKANHDGILITSGEHIIFHNNKSKKLFEKGSLDDHLSSGVKSDLIM
jgi:hypothetical protein